MERLDNLQTSRVNFGKLAEVDWNSMVTSYGEMVRLRIKCKNPAKIPGRRVFEIDDKLYLVRFNIEDDLGGLNDTDNGGNDEDDDFGDDPAFEDTEKDSQRGTDKGKMPKPKSSKSSEGKEGEQKCDQSQRGTKSMPLWASLFKENL